MSKYLYYAQFEFLQVKNSNVISTLRNISESLKNAQRVHAELDEFGQANIEMDGKRFKIAVQKGILRLLKLFIE